MSKPTDYKKKWRQVDETLTSLQNEVNNGIIPRMMQAEQMLVAIVYEQIDLDDLRAEYFKNNPKAPTKEVYEKRLAEAKKAKGIEDQ